MVILENSVLYMLLIFYMCYVKLFVGSNNLGNLKIGSFIVYNWLLVYWYCKFRILFYLWVRLN